MIYVPANICKYKTLSISANIKVHHPGTSNWEETQGNPRNTKEELNILPVSGSPILGT